MCFVHRNIGRYGGRYTYRDVQTPINPKKEWITAEGRSLLEAEVEAEEGWRSE